MACEGARIRRRTPIVDEALNAPFARCHEHCFRDLGGGAPGFAGRVEYSLHPCSDRAPAPVRPSLPGA